MKKYIYLMGVIMISLILLNIKPTYGLENNDLNNIHINSNELLTFIKEEEITNIKKLCTYDFCDYLRSTNIEDSIEIFKQKYKQYLMTKTNEETAISTILKGFPITKIELLNE